MPRSALAAAAALLALAVGAALFVLASPPPSDPRPEGGARAPGVPAPAAAPAPTTGRERVDASPVAASGFVSKTQEGEVVADAVRDGLDVLVLRQDRAPVADAEITAFWRKGFGLYGWDAGHTDARGRFATTVHAVEQLESVALHDSALGELRADWGMLPLRDDPRTVLVIVPNQAAVRMRVVDFAREPVAGAAIKATAVAFDDVPREHVLHGDERTATTDERGAAVLSLPRGWHEFEVEAPGCRAVQKLCAEVPADGRDLLLFVARDEAQHEVVVTVHAPADLQETVWVNGWSNAVPLDDNRRQRAAAESIQRQFVATRRDATHFVLRVDPLPWCATAGTKGSWENVQRVDVGPLQTAVDITVVHGAPPPPVARLHCTITGPDGNPVEAYVRVTDRPLIGSSGQCTDHGHVDLVEPAGRRVVVAATVDYELPPAFAGPIDLTPGDHDVRLRFAAPQRVTGRVVDAAGQPVDAHVYLNRPAPELHALDPDTPSLFNVNANGDTSGTGSDGRFWFDTLTDCEHEIFVDPTGPQLPARKRVHGGQDVTIVVGEGFEDAARVHGTLTSGATGRPLVTVRIACETGQLTSGYTDGQGAFALALPSGPGKVTVRAPQCVVLPIAHMFVAGDQRLDLVVPADTPRFLRLVDADSVPLRGARVSALDARGEPIDLADPNGNDDGDVEHTNAPGRVVLRGLAPGPLRLRVTVGDHSREFALGADDGVASVHALHW
jgi:hypothetical protein